MNEAQYKTLNDGDIVKLRGNSAQGPIVSFPANSTQIQFAYQENDGHIALAQLPYSALELVEAHPGPSVPRGTTGTARQRVRG